ncbi:hypothetical protein H4582DRAFT_334190 [Lactarius indigo]|nr:hypothetical protein H4582DRAFT_334190 [Lactarius indigo]
MLWIIVSSCALDAINGGETADQKVSSSIAWTPNGRSPHIPLRDHSNMSRCNNRTWAFLMKYLTICSTRTSQWCGVTVLFVLSGASDEM